MSEKGDLVGNVSDDNKVMMPASHGFVLQEIVNGPIQPILCI